MMPHHRDVPAGGKPAGRARTALAFRRLPDWNAAMPSTKARPTQRLPQIVRVMRARPRLVLAACLAAAVIVLLPGRHSLASRMIIGWDVGVVAYLLGAAVAIGRADIARIRRQAAQEDEGQLAILTLTAAASLACLGAIVFELVSAGKQGRDPLHLALAIVTIALSWAFIHTIFALHYAHEFYAEGRHKSGGLAFPGDAEPDYWDFVYFSLVIGMTSQVSDVAVTAKPIRRIVTAHGVVSFVFNTTLLALAVNIAASAL
jgi:uncharacterized membrane protein